MTISPWNDFANQSSPDGRFVAIIDNAFEIGMGAPTSGTLEIKGTQKDSSSHFHLDFCSPSFVWSTASDAIAVPQWNFDNRRQRLVVVSLPSGKLMVVPGDFSVLELHSFSDGVIRGIDSPAHEPTKIEVRVSVNSR